MRHGQSWQAPVAKKAGWQAPAAKKAGQSWQAPVDKKAGRPTRTRPVGRHALEPAQLGPDQKVVFRGQRVQASLGKSGHLRTSKAGNCTTARLEAQRKTLSGVHISSVCEPSHKPVDTIFALEFANRFGKLKRKHLQAEYPKCLCRYMVT